MFFSDKLTTSKNNLEEKMKKTLSLFAVLAVAGMADTPAQAATNYISGLGGISWMNNMKLDEVYQGTSNHSIDYDLGSGVNILGAIGCDYGNYRFEAEVGYQRNNLKTGSESTNGIVDVYPYAMKGDVSVLSLMANGYYDFDLGSKVDFYATAGVGVAQVSFLDENDVIDPDPGYTGHETTLAGQVGAGLAAPITDNVKLDLRYRYFATTDLTFSEGAGSRGQQYYTYNTNVSSHSVLLGLRVDF
jgi:opacity protein-like surface antigen